MEHFYNDIEGGFTFPDLYASMVRRFDSGAVFVELGVWKGRSAAFMGTEIINSGKKIEFHLIDTWEDSAEHIGSEALLEQEDGLYNHFLENIKPIIKSINIHRGDGQVVVNDFADNSIDFIFINAAHGYLNVVRDIKAWLPKLKKNGIIAGHDIHHPPIRQALNELLPFFTETSEDIWMVEKDDIPSARKRYDCFPFFNELDLLEIRLNVTAPYVDKWIISESNKTYSGKDKPFYLKDNLERFAKFKDRIIIVNYSHVGGVWETEYESRNCIGRYLKTIAQPDDCIILSDCDEIPDLAKVSFGKAEVQRFDMPFYYYYMNCFTGHRWNQAKMFPYSELAVKTMQELRMSNNGILITDAGWHWSCLGGAERIRIKLQAGAHQELNHGKYIDVERINKMIRSGEDIFDRGWNLKFVSMDNFPPYVVGNVKKYAELINNDNIN